jgi:uncharacterized protein YoxC
MENIASVSEENSAAVEEVSASVEEMSAQVEEVNASAQSLATMAEVLQDIVRQFKLTQTQAPVARESTPVSHLLSLPVRARNNGHRIEKLPLAE